MAYFLIGIFTGFINGLFGAGGGLILVPAMERFLKVEAHKAHATAIACILPLTVLSAILYIFVSKKSMDMNALLFVTIGGIGGGFFGAKLLNKLPKYWLKKIFAVFMITAAVRMIF